MRARQQLGTFLVLAAALCLPSTVYAQGTVMPVPRQVFLDNDGDPLASGKVCTYDAGTTTARAVYSDVLLASSLPNPFILNGSGRPQTNLGTETNVYLSATSYKFVLMTAGSDNTCSTGTVIWTADNVASVPTTATGLDVDGTAGEALAAGDFVYMSDGSGGNNAGRWYKADADFVYASTTPSIGVVPTAIASGASGTIRVGGRMTALSALIAGTTYYVSATAGALTSTAPTNARAVGQADSTTTLVLGDQNAAGVIQRTMRVNAATPYTLTWPAADAAGALQSTGAGVLSFGAVTMATNTVEGRLTLTTGTPVTSGDVSAATTLFWAPYKGNRIALYTGSAWTTVALSQLSITLVGLAASRPFDVFIDYTAGTPVLELVVWTNDTTRATALATQDGVLVQTADADSRYVGTIYTDAGGGAVTDSVSLRHVWNYYNRVARSLRVLEATGTWTYQTNTWRQARATATNQVGVVIGVQEVVLALDLQGGGENGTANLTRQIGIGEDSTTAPMANQVMHSPFSSNVATNVMSLVAQIRHYPAVGRHFYAWLERASATAPTTFYGTAGGGELQSGMIGEIEG